MPTTASDFYLVQRLSAANSKGINPFGYGRMFDAFDLDYMGAAEFEYGAIPASVERLLAADAIERSVIDVQRNGVKHAVELLYPAGTDPVPAFRAWSRARFHPSKEWPWSFVARLEGKGDEYTAETLLWWSLDNDVVFGFSADGQVERFAALLDASRAARREQGAA